MTETMTIPRCPIHDMPDCSPLLNGCSLVIRAVNQTLTGKAPAQPPEPKQLLACVTDIRGVRWFRWAYDSHTCCPWREMGACATQIEDEADLRWTDLPAVAVISDGVPV